MNITFFGYDEGGCGYYRALSPMATIAKYKAANVTRLQKGDDLMKLNDALINADVVFAPHLSDERIIGILEAVKKDGKKIVVDFDDYIFDISPLSPHYEECGTKNVKYKFANGTVVDLWKDGVAGFDIKKNQKHLENMRKAMEFSDLITTTTDILADKLMDIKSNVEVLPNCVDLNVWKNYEFKRKSDEIRLYWSGGSSHYEDWCVLSQVLPEIMKKYRNVKLVIMGHKFKGALKGVPDERIEFHPWVLTPAYPYKTILNCPDISLIPLRETEFNRCKSAIKWIEMGALGIPSVSTYMAPYSEMDNGKNGVFIEDNDVDGWIEGISMLVEDPLLRADIGGKARKYVEQHYDINKNYPKWLNAYKGLFH